MATKKLKPVVVTDKYRGVVFGYLVKTAENGNAAHLKGGRIAYYYDTTEGVTELAVKGPGPKSKIMPAADMIVRGVAKIINTTNEAAKKWDSAQWAR
jgi:hypothetical protein